MLRSLLLVAVPACGFSVHAANPAVLAPGLAVARFGGEGGATAMTTAIDNLDAAAIGDVQLRVGPQVDLLLAGSWTSTGFAEAVNAAGSLRVRRRIGDELKPVDLAYGGGIGAGLGYIGDSRGAVGTHGFIALATTDRSVRVFTDVWIAAALEHRRSHPFQVGARYGWDLGAGDVSLRPMIGCSRQWTRVWTGGAILRQGATMIELGLSLRVRGPGARDQRPPHEKVRRTVSRDRPPQHPHTLQAHR